MIPACGFPWTCVANRLPIYLNPHRVRVVGIVGLGDKFRNLSWGPDLLMGS